MKNYRFYYIFCSCTTETYIRANSKEEAIEKFKQQKGDRTILNIEEVRNVK